MKPFYQSLLFVLLAITSITLGGCNRRTPEERLAKAMEFFQQNDSLSAEVEARKIIEKSADDPAAIRARMLLAQIYIRDNRLDEAVAEVEPALEKVDQKDAAGKQVLGMYLQILQRQKKWAEALKVVDKYQKQYSEDPGTSLSLIVARADIQTKSGDTTSARQILTGLRETTTSPAEQKLYRDMTAQTYQRDRDTTGLIQFFEQELKNASNADNRRVALSALGEIHAGLQEYDKSRQYTEQLTEAIDKSLADELDSRAKAALELELAAHYSSVGNYPGARRIYQALFDSGQTEAQVIMATVVGQTETLLKQGEKDAALGFLKEAASRYPTAPFGQQAAQLESMKAQNKLDAMIPQDTSTLVMKYKEGKILVPNNLPKIDVSTSGTVISDLESTATTAETTGTVLSSKETSPTQ